jgi:hypothetical protein
MDKDVSLEIRDLNVPELKRRFNQEMVSFGIESYAGILIMEKPKSICVLQEGHILSTNSNPYTLGVELILVFLRERQPTLQLLSECRDCIVAPSLRPKVVAYSIGEKYWDDYELRTIIDSLIFSDFKQFFPQKGSANYMVDYYRDTGSGAPVVQPQNLAIGVTVRKNIR